MKKNFHIDSLDKKILFLLSKNARIPFLKIARQCKVTGAAIHQRIQKLQNSDIISGYEVNINQKGLGYYSCAFIGIQVNLTSTRSHEDVFNKIKIIPEIVECHHITGRYSLFIKIYAQNNENLKKIIVEKIQSIEEVTGTETFLSLEEGFTRQLVIEYN